MIQPIFRMCLLAGLAAAVLAPGVQAQESEAAAPVNLDSELSKQCYSAGAMIGKGVLEPGLELDIDAFLAGMQAALSGQEFALDESEMRNAFRTLQQNMQTAAREKAASMADEAKSAGEAYLAENAQKEGWNVTESGLQYKVVEEGDGASPAATDKVSVYYRGTFIDGEVFDENMEGDPASFNVNGVIRGWTEALQMMKVGAKWQLAIPSELAYGQGRGPIPPNSVLLFEVQLLSIDN